MGQPIMVACDVCASQATVVMGAYTDASGKSIEWPKANVKEDGIYFAIECPKCGLRDQRMATPGDND